MDVHSFLCVPSVALWSHTAAELLLLWLAFAGFLLGGLCVLILALQYVEAGVPRSVSFSRRWVFERVSQSSKLFSFFSGYGWLGVASWPALLCGLSQFLQRSLAYSHTRQCYLARE